MVSEQICLDVIRALHGHTSTMTRTMDPQGPNPSVQRSVDQNALSDSALVRPLLVRYEMSDIDAAIRWLQLGEYLGRTEWGVGGPWVHHLTKKGETVAHEGAFPAADRGLFYLVVAHQVFLAHQFRYEDEGYERDLRDVLGKEGYRVVDGKVDGLEEFRHAIVEKIRKSRFIVCLLTHRARLESGTHVSSVWLYQEIGAAVALGKSPLLLVEDGMDNHYAGELQKTYEYIPFTARSFSSALPEIVRRFGTELERHHIPGPRATSSGGRRRREGAR